MVTTTSSKTEVNSTNNIKKVVTMKRKVLNEDTINPCIKRCEYAVRGELAIRAEELREQLERDPDSLPFKHVINTNIGNPQQLGQKPITFFRQVTALIEYPDLMDDEHIEFTKHIFPEDTIERAKALLESMGGSSGAYSHSKGIPLVRKHVAEFIEERDGYPCSPEDIFLTAGGSQGVQTIIQLAIANENVGIMIPIPQYPLYSASIDMYGGKPVYYYLDESNEWSIDGPTIHKAIEDAKKKNIDVRVLCVINPGNPTGQCLSEETIRDIIEICHKERVVVLADEVYQTNIYDDSRPFYSFKKVLKSMGPEYEDFELFSFHSVSKGMVGECGRRGAYFECTGIDKYVMDQLYKMASVNLCPNVQGQVMVDLVTRPPREGEPSYDLYNSEITEIYDSLRRRASKLAAFFNSLEGVSCHPPQGALYLFPKVTLPEKAVIEAKKLNKSPDTYYCLELLDHSGVCVVPGTGFGQVEGTFHFRSTFLPPEELFDEFIEKIKIFHEEFMNKFK